jgi:pSer/pThr/pTyr-binding forkhead associated (FHA) protein
VLVEDMSSANGTFINDKRIQNGLLKPGEELRLDTVRFMLVAPGMDAKQQATARAEPQKAPPQEASGAGGKVFGVIIAIIVVAAIAFFAARYYGIV